MGDGPAGRTLGTDVTAAGLPLVGCGLGKTRTESLWPLSLTQLLDALLVLNEQLDSGDVNV